MPDASREDTDELMQVRDSLFDGVRAVLLDLDGTLIETDNRWASVMAQKLEFVKRLFPKADSEALGRSLVMAIETPVNYVMLLCEHLGLGSSFFGLADRLRRSKGLATSERSALVPGTEKLLNALRTRYALAVVTTRARPEAYAFIEQASLSAYFRAVVTRQDVWRIKPHPAPVNKGAELLSVMPSQCIMVGDTTMDVRAARRAGAFAVGVTSGFGTRDELERAGAHLVLDRAVQLLDHLPD